MWSQVSKQIKQRIAEHGPPQKIQEICMDQMDLSQIQGTIPYLGECLRVQYLSICSCRLTNIAVLPLLPELQMLELSHNKLTGKGLQRLVSYPKLTSLTFNNNLIENLVWIQALTKSKISELSLIGNPVASSPVYKDTLYRLLQNLSVLDGYDKYGNSAVVLQSSIQQSIELSQSDQQVESESQKDQVNAQS